MPAHRDLIVEQFTKQAVPFSTAPGIRDEEALRLLVEFTGAGPEDTVLDVACGPGLVVCALAAEKFSPVRLPRRMVQGKR